jgi:hypothetical protein
MSCATLLRNAEYFWPAKSVILMSRPETQWRARAELTFEMSGNQYCIYDWEIAGFLRARGGKVVINGSQCIAGECTESDDGCRAWRATLVGDRVVEIPR